MKKLLFASFLVLVLSIAACGPVKQATQESVPAPVPQPAEQVQPAPEPTPAPQPAEVQPKEESKLVVEDNQASNAVYDNVDMVTDVSCNYDKGTVSFHFKNVAKRTLDLYKGQFQPADSALKFTINSRQFNAPKSNLKLTCTKDEFAPGEEGDCFGENAVFRKDVQFNQNGENRLLGQIIGLSDLTLFQCGPTTQSSTLANTTA